MMVLAVDIYLPRRGQRRLNIVTQVLYSDEIPIQAFRISTVLFKYSYYPPFIIQNTVQLPHLPVQTMYWVSSL